jgi:hypothetical protein
MRSVARLLVFALLVAVSGCEQRGPTVYVLEGPQTIELQASASATQVKVGETVELHVERRTTGNWKQVPRNELKPGQCWTYRPPAEFEPEVAQSVKWEVNPENTVQFHTEYRMDQKRLATMMVQGTIQLTPVMDEVKCEEGRTVTGPTLEIEVS